MFKIHLLIPNVNTTFDMDRFTKSFSDETLCLSWSPIKAGPASIEGEVDAALATPSLLQEALFAEKSGVDALIVDCMGDPGFFAIREAVRIPTFGPCQTSMHLAATLGQQFSVVTLLRRLHSQVRARAVRYGVEKLMGPVRSVNMSVLDVEQSHEYLISALVAESIHAVEMDQSDVIVLGCTGFEGVIEDVRHSLTEKGFGDLQVIEPLTATIRYAEMMLKLGLSHSKLGYPLPEEKPIFGYEPWDRSE